MPERNQYRYIFHACVFLFLASLAIPLVAGCLFARACALDDSVLVSENPLVNGQLPWWKAFTNRHYYQYTPVTFLCQRANAFLFGLDAAWSFRLVNWLIHASSAFILWRILNRLGAGRRGSLFVAGAWAVHPMACESVAWISERSNALAFFFGAVSFWTYVKWHGRWQGIAWSILAFSAALLSKPLALGWLPVFVVLELLGGPRRLAGGLSSDLEEENLRPRWGLAGVRLLPLFALAMALMFVGLNSYETAVRPPPGGTWFTALLTDTGLFLRYVWNTLIPVGLSSMYAVRDIASLTDGRLWLNLLVWLMLVGGSVALAGSRRRALFGWLWFFGGLGPACNVIAVGYPMQDRYAYLASAGLLLVVAEVAGGLGLLIPGRKGRHASASKTVGNALSPAGTGASEGNSESGGRTERAKAAESAVSAGTLLTYAGPVLSAFYIAFLAVLSLQRAPLWGDNLALMRQAAEREPDGALPHIFYGTELEWQAREIGWNASIYPPEARAFHRAAAEQFALASRQPDAYLYDPFALVILSARNQVLGERHREAIELLAVSMPDLSRTQIISKYGIRHALVPEKRFGFQYPVPLLMVAEGHYWMGEAHLAWACEEGVDPPAPLLDRVRAEALKTLAINPACFEAYALLCKDALFRDVFQKDLASARKRVVLAAPQLEQMGRTPEIAMTLTPGVPLSRVHALGCLAMARAARCAAGMEAGIDQERFRAAIQGSFTWAKRAVELDPALGEGFWFQADLLRSLADERPGRNAEECRRWREDCVAALKSIRPNSPRFAQARQLLRELESGR